jgi:hypothetical protein
MGRGLLLVAPWISNVGHLSGARDATKLSTAIVVLFRATRQVLYSSLKGQGLENDWLWFFHQTTSSLVRPAKDLEFFRIFEELFVFVINSPVYSPPLSHDSPVYSSPWSWDQISSQKTCWCIIHQEIKTPLWLIHWGFFTHCSICHQKVY